MEGYCAAGSDLVFSVDFHPESVNADIVLDRVPLTLDVRLKMIFFSVPLSVTMSLETVIPTVFECWQNLSDAHVSPHSFQNGSVIHLSLSGMCTSRPADMKQLHFQVSPSRPF